MTTQETLSLSLQLLILERRARRVAEDRGHELGPWERSNPRGLRYLHLSANQCIRCGCWLQVNSDPLPNQIDIGGTAVALNCQPEAA